MNKKRTWILIFGAIILLGIFKCPLYEITGIPCPTCGMTRAWRSFIFLDFATAFSMHPLFWIPPLFLLKKMQNKWALWAVFGIFIAVYIIRMLFLFPHTPPMNFNYDGLLGGLFK